MKSFIKIQKSLERVGVYRHQTAQNYLLNFKNFTVLSIFAQNITFTAILLTDKSCTFGEYFESFYYIATLIAVAVVIHEFVRKTLKINTLITNFENAIQKRKC